MENLCDSTNVMDEVEKALLSESKIDINNLFEGEKTVSFKHADEEIGLNYSLKKGQVSNLLRLTLSHLLQYTENHTLTEINNYNCKIIIISLLHIARDLDHESDITFLKECTNTILKNSSVLQYFLPVYKKKDLTEKMFTETLLELCLVLHTFSEDCICIEAINAYRNKLITSLKSTIEKCETKEKIKHNVNAEFFQVLQLNISQMVDLIQMIMKLPYEQFLSSKKTHLSIWGIAVPKLIDVCLEKRCISDKSIFPLDIDLFKKLFSYLIKLKSSKVEVISWEESLYKYLFRFPHSIGDIDKRAFISLLQSHMSEATIKLISLLINRNPVVISHFVKLIKNNDRVMRNSSIIFSLLGSNLTYDWDKLFLSKLYELHKTEIVDFLTEPADKSSWVQENSKAVIYLIKTNFDSETCQQICNNILENGDKLNKVNKEYVQILESLFQKIKAYKEFLQVLIHLIASTLKLCKNKASMSKNKNKLEFLCQTLLNTIETLKKNEENFRFEELSKNHSWPQFVRFSLTQGLKLTDDEIFLDNVLLLKTLIAACNVVYYDNGSDEYVKTIFGLTTTHSQYADIMLSSTKIKRYLVELILTLVRKNTSTMLPNHIPFYLSAYNATLSESDQIILLIIKHYEKSNINLSKYRPFLWGSAAASHYSVKDDPNSALWRQPKTSQILDLFLPEMVENTITRFPVQRSLKDETLCAPENVYDPVFYLPVLCEVLSVHNPVAYYKVTHSGALALMLIACCSNCEQIRLAGFTNLSRFYFHLENLDIKRSNERLLWIRFIDALRNGIAELGTSMKEVCLNGFVATFLARASIVGTKPLHPLYWPLHKFFMAKSALKLNTIPEFKKLFQSTEVDYEEHRCWILKVIRDGFRSETDLQIAVNCSVFNILLSFYTSSLSNKRTRKLILEIINSIAKMPKSGLLLVQHYGKMPWLDAITDRLEKSDSDFVPLMIDITKNFLDSFLKRKATDKFPSFALMQVLLTLRFAMTSKNLPVSSFTTYVDTVERMLVFKDLNLSEDYIKDLLEFSKELLGSMIECEDLLEYGSKYALKEDDSQSEDTESIARRSMRKLIIRWHSYKKLYQKNERMIAYPDGSTLKLPCIICT